MSSIGMITLITPLLPWRPAILSPGWMRRFTAKVHLHDLQHAGRKVVATFELAALVEQLRIQLRTALRELLFGAINLIVQRVFAHANAKPVVLASASFKIFTGRSCRPSPCPGPLAARFAVRCAARQIAHKSQLQRCGIHRPGPFLTFDDLCLLNLLRACILFDAIACEDLHVDHGALDVPCRTRSEVSFTSEAFSPKIARNSFSSGVSCVSPLGVTLPTRMSPVTTSAPMYTTPDSSSFDECGLTDIGNVTGHFFGAEFGIARDAGVVR